MKTEQEQLELIRRCIDGTASKDDRNALQEQLRREPSVRRLYARYANIDATLGSGGIALKEPAPTAKASRTAWLSWRPIAAAAAGLAIGMFCTSVVFAYAQPRSPVVVSKMLPVADAEFESGSQIPAQGIPSRAGSWSGDFSRVVTAENGITPKQGQHMLRFLRSDNELDSKNAHSYVGSAAQVIDLRPLRAELSGTEQLVEVSAQFDSIATSLGERYEFNMKAAAFRGDLADAPKLWEDHEASVSRSDRTVVADSDTATWQRVAVPLMVPPDADFLVIECAVVRKGLPLDQRATEFPGHYVDQVEVLLSSSEKAKIAARRAN
jgi:hypothetical protein